ncbi:MAG: hypothetical protein ACTSRU_03950 [Candidatus Hodarchaeales archaeon]
MNFRKSQFGLVFLAMILILSCSTGTFQVSAQAGQENKVILIDEGHGQFFNRSLLSNAIDAISDLGDVDIYFTSESFTDEILSGVDLLIITNPGSNDDDVFSQIEMKATGDWMSSGEKGLFLLCNPYSEDNASLTGNPVPLNDLISSSYLQVGGTRFYFEPGTLSSNIIRNGSDADETPFLLDITIDNNQLQYLNSSYDNMSLLVKSCSLESDIPIVSSGYNSYSLAQQSNPDLQEVNPVVFGISVAGHDSKVALGGSTLMFSDLPSPQGNSWFNSSDNSLLFIEAINWLLGEDKAPAPSLLENALVVPLTIAIAGLIAITGGMFLSRNSLIVPLSEKPYQEIDVVETEDIVAKETTMSKRQRKFAQRKKAAKRIK